MVSYGSLQNSKHRPYHIADLQHEISRDRSVAMLVPLTTTTNKWKGFHSPRISCKSVSVCLFVCLFKDVFDKSDYAGSVQDTGQYEAMAD